MWNRGTVESHPIGDRVHTMHPFSSTSVYRDDILSTILTRGVWQLSLVHRHNWTKGVFTLRGVSNPHLLRPLSLSRNFISILVDCPYEVIEVEEELLVVALATVVVLLVGGRPAKYTMW